MSQCVNLEVVDGPRRGRTYTIPAGSSLLIGRLLECGFSIPEDLTVSRQQFRIEFNPPQCRLVHLSQTGETFVNRVAVTTTDLVTGDVITFGTGNLVRVRVEESSNDVPATVVVTGPDLSNSKSSGRFSVRPLKCGWSVHTGLDSKSDFERVLTILGNPLAAHAVFDFRQLGQTAPAEPEEPKFLFSWMPSEMQKQFSPAVMLDILRPSVRELLRTGWSHDGIVCFGSAAALPAILDHWKKAIGMNGDQPGSSMTVYYRPSVLNQLLACQTEEQLQPLLSELNWLLVEAPEQPAKWNLYSRTPLTTRLTEAGLTVEESAKG